MRHFESPKIQPSYFRKYKVFDKGIYHEVLSTAKKIYGLEVFHINSTAIGGGVAEILQNQVGLERSLGINSHWLVLKQPKNFFVVTKGLHNLLQGKKGHFSKTEKELYLRNLEAPGLELSGMLNKKNTKVVVVLHDPQPLPLAGFIPSRIKIISRIHIDLSEPNPEALRFLKLFLDIPKTVILSNKLFQPAWLDDERTLISYPAINPFDAKNISLSKAEINSILSRHNISTKSPFILQVSRFDPWKDPIGVVRAFEYARRKGVAASLILEGSLGSKDDPESALVFKKLKRWVGNPETVKIFGPGFKPKVEYRTWINALQSAAMIVLQKSIKEGFGLTVTEALWKAKPVVGGNTLGIKAQIQDQSTGLIVNSPEECGEAIFQLSKNERLRVKLGQRGKNLVKKEFLFNRLILQHLTLYEKLVLGYQKIGNK